MTTETTETSELPAWFERTRLGLFVHWGISSVHGGVDLSWGMIGEKPWDDAERSIPPATYWDLAEEFDPDPDWDRALAAARRAGMEYAVLTARHHDGYALWPTDHGSFGVSEYLDGRDLVGEFVAACRRQGLKVGLYYSPTDWHHPDCPTSIDADAWTDEPIPYGALGAGETTAEDLVAFERFFGYVRGQVSELLGRYDPDLLWFDGGLGGDVDDRMGELYALARSTCPGIVVNDRGHGLGDYDTPECTIPPRPMAREWERCQTWGGAWGYVADEPYNDEAWTLATLAETVGRGGRLLLNVGPDADGALPPTAREGLDALADWMADSRPSVAGVEAGPWPERAPVPITRGDGVWYVHVLADHAGPVTVREVPEPAAVRLLRTGDPVAHAHDAEEGTLTIDLEPDRRASPDEVVAVSWGHREQFSRHGRLRQTPD